MHKAFTSDWYARKFNENESVSVIVKYKQLLKKYTKIWKTIEGLMKINFEIKPVCGEDIKYIKTKIKTCRQHNHKFS